MALLRKSLGLPLTGKQTRAFEEHLLRVGYNYTSRMVHTGNAVEERTSMDVDGVFEGVKMLNEAAASDRLQSRRYLGSVDILTAEVWAKECGAAVGTKEWAAYAKKKLKSGDYGKFAADQSIQKGVHSWR